MISALQHGGQCITRPSDPLQVGIRFPEPTPQECLTGHSLGVGLGELIAVSGTSFLGCAVGMGSQKVFSPVKL